MKRTRSKIVKDNSIIAIELDRELYFRCGNAAAATGRSFEQFHEQALLTALQRAGVEAGDLMHEQKCRHAYETRGVNPVRYETPNPSF